MGKRKRGSRTTVPMTTVTTTTTGYGVGTGTGDVIWNIPNMSSNFHLGHIMADPSVVSHCPFCGSGAIIAGGDGTITCDFCDRAFNVMEQPKYNAMPGDPNAVPPASGMPSDPALDPAAVDPNAPLDPAAATPAPNHAPVNPQTDPEALSAAPPFKMGDGKPKDDEPKKDNPFAKGGMRTTAVYKTAKGTPLNEDDFVAHLAFLHGREFMVGS